MEKLFNLDGKLSIVTGAASGLGKAIATGLAECGSDVIIVDRNGEGLLNTEEELKKFGKEIINFKTDLSSLEDIDKLFEKVDLLKRNIDFLANVAGE
jgi:NAD(P)-dependent dehydrogenase (short-subunit alcohol dehydrogenase family)